MLNFLIGTGRCGSTLVHDVIARHPDVSFVSNLDDRWRRTPASVRPLNGIIYRRMPTGFRKRLRPSEGYVALSREVSPTLVNPFRDLVAADATPWLADRLRVFFESRGATEPGQHFVHKFTLWPRASFLHEVFPEARFVHIVRDGRAVANSLLQMTWWSGYLGPSRWELGPLSDGYAQEWEREGRSLVHLAGIGWKLLMDAFEVARTTVPSDLWFEVRYEDLLADPRKHMDMILEFLGLPWTKGFERGLARHEFSPGRADAFRKDLSREQLALLEYSLASHLHRYGYAT
ncbi:sulfotransferase family protein [Planotetraspora kaengkrachanensis]|uniref:Sulfotransferase n=1 Tax=Planotetraspora kaengkrachanensis TaxID=575193 RepID=A0A8J3PTD4_9ACTN|nr:sulfotransferase [Planotetraspora kaengkrachanensis]GIG79631.1 hypothetical protein Pka01_27580 [Planotetraspora kaengkrachanensis]